MEKETQQEINKLREEINVYDNELIETLVKRFEVVKKISHLKNGPMEDLEREENIFQKLQGKGLPSEFIKKLYSLIFNHSKETYSKK